MLESQNMLVSQSTMACESQKIQNNYSLCGIIPLSQIIENNLQYVQFKSLLPMKAQNLIRYVICLCQQLIETEKRRIHIEEINLQTLKTDPIENQSYIFFLQEQNHHQDLTLKFKHLLNQLSFNKNIYYKETKLEKIACNLIRESKSNLSTFIKFDLEQFSNCYRFVRDEIRINVLQPNNIKSILYKKEQQISNPSVFLITKPSYITCQEQEVVIKISKNNTEQQDKYLREIEILESFQDDINFKYYGYFRFESLTFSFYKYYKQTFDQFQEKVKSDISNNLNDIQLIQSIVKRALINITQQMILINNKYQIIHRDLKPQNIMIDSQNDLNEWQEYQDANYVIIDFDCSIQIQFYKQDIFQTYGGGTSYYVPPEYYTGEYTPQYDTYQLGVIFLETLFKIEGNIFKDGFWNCTNQLQDAKSQFKITDELKKVLISMVNQFPDQRPSLKIIQQSLEIGL